MDCHVEIDLGQNLFRDVILSFRVNSDEIIMDYTDMEKEDIILDKLSSFQKIEFSDSNPLQITLVGPNISRSFKFQDEDSLSSFFSYLQQFVSFESISGMSRAYLISPLTKYDSKITSKLNAFLKKKSPAKDVKILVPEAISSNIIRDSLSDLTIVEVDENNYETIFDKNGTIKSSYEISHIEIKFDFVFDLWKQVLSISPQQEDFEDYRKLLSQWNPVYISQWENDSELRKFVALFENDLSVSHLNENFRKLAFEIILSFYYQTMGKMTYSTSLYQIISFLIDSSIICENKLNTENRFYLHNGDVSDRENISVILFSMFSELYDRFIDSSNPRFNFVTKETFTESVNEILADISPSTLQLIKQFEITNYDFIFPYVQSFLAIGRIQSDERYLFTAIITAKSPQNFIASLIATSFIMLHCRLAKIPFNQPDTFKEIFTALLIKIDVRLLLSNARSIQRSMSDLDLADNI